MVRSDPAAGRTAAFAVLAVGFSLSQFWRSILAVLAPELIVAFETGPEFIGVLGSAFFLAFAAGQMPSGLLLDRIGPRRMVVGGLLTCAAAATVFASVPVAGVSGAAQVVMGAACSPLLMGAFVFVAQTWPADAFGLLIGRLLGLGMIGGIASTAPLAVAADAVGWRVAVVGAAALTVLTAVAVAVVLPPAAKRGGGEPRRTLAADLAGFRTLLAMRALWPVLAMMLVAVAIIMTLRTVWAGPFLADVYGFGTVARGNILLVLSLAMAVGSVAYGSVQGGRVSAPGLVMFGSVCAVAGLTVLAILPSGSPWGLSVLVLTLTGTGGVVYGPLMAYGKSRVPTHLTGRGVTFINQFVFLGTGIVNALTGVAVGAAMAAGMAAPAVYRGVFLVWALAMASVALFFFFTSVRGAQPTGETEEADDGRR